MITVFLLTSLTVVVYAGVLQNDFLDYDDKRIILDNIGRYDGINLENIIRIFSEDFPREEPLIVRDLSYLVNAEIFGEINPQGYLIGNVFLHILVSFLVYRLTLLLFPQNHLLAIFASALFSIHPLHVESIAWISSRKDPLYTAFYLAALLQFGNYLFQGRKKSLLVSYLLFVFALFSKAAAISFLPTVLIFRFCFRKTRKITGMEGIYFLSQIGSLALFVKWYTSVLTEYGIIQENLNSGRDWTLWFLNSCEYLKFYIEKLIFPFNLSIVYDYPSPNLLYQNIFSVSFAAILVLVICAVAYWFLYKEYNNYAFLILFFICSFMPYLDLAQVNIYVADRYAYLSSVPFCILAVVLVQQCYSCLVAKSKILTVVMIACCIGITFSYVINTRYMTTVWRNAFTLWSNAERNTKYRTDAYTGLLREYIRLYINSIGSPNAQKILSEAQIVGERGLKKHCNSDLKCPERVIRIVTYLAEIYWQQKQYGKAEEWFEKAIHLNPEFVDSRFMYINLLIQLGEYELAANHTLQLEKYMHPYKDRKMLTEVTTRIWPTLNSKPGNVEKWNLKKYE